MSVDRVKRVVALSLYLPILRWLPQSSLPGGSLWKLLRAVAARSMLAYCGRDVNVEHGASFGSGAHVRLGNRSGIGVNCRLHGPVAIGNDVMMGPDVVVIALGHEFSDITRPMMDQGHTPVRPVTIGDDVWIGTRVIILPGVTIGAHSVVAAGAVVTRDVPAWSVVGGNPAQVIRNRRILNRQ